MDYQIKNPEAPSLEKAVYGILLRRKIIVPEPTYDEYLTAAKKVVSRIPPEKITPIEDLINGLELTLLRNRGTVKP
jgi:hypothetical protein